MFTITPIKAFDDNYIWAIVEPSTRQVIVIDAGQAEPVINFISDNDLKLTAIWITHKHFDHTGGVKELQAKYPDVHVVAHGKHGVVQDSEVVEGSEFVAFKQTVKVVAVTGHTENHLAYLLPFFDNESLEGQLHVFCGDTLFSGGCGRVFTGDMLAMYNSLQRLANLDEEMSTADDNIFFYPAHEYTASNLKFGLHIEVDNTAMSNHLAKVEQLNSEGKPSLPTSLALEKQVNVFLRTDNTTVVDSVLEKMAIQQSVIENPTDEAIIFAELRGLKDVF